MPSAGWSQRDTQLAAALAIVTPLIAWSAHRGPFALSAPAACPGLLDLGAAWTSRLLPNTAVGAWILPANAVMLAMAIAAITIALRLWSGSWIASTAASVALALQPGLAPVLAPFDPALTLVGALTCLALVLSPRSQLAAVGIGATAMINPAATVPLAIVGGAAAFMADPGIGIAARRRRALITIAAIVVAGAAVTWLMPALPGSPATSTLRCLWLGSSTVSAHTWMTGVRTVSSAAGPYAFGLTVLGMFSIVTRRAAAPDLPSWRRLIVFLVYAAFAGLAAEVGQSPLRSFGPLWIGFWIALTMGLTELVRACARTAGGRLAAALCLVLLPVFQWLTLRAAPAPGPSFGVERLSARSLKQFLAVLPDRSAIAQEDATQAALLRGLAGTWQRMGKQIALVPADPDAVVSATGAGRRIFAFPTARARLQWLGVRFADAGLPSIAGVDAASTGGPCQRIKTRWQAAPWIPAAGTSYLSITLDDLGEEHGAVMYIASDREVHPSPTGGSGPGVILRQASYQPALEADRIRLEGDVLADQVNSDLAGGLRPLVTRIAVWRTAGPAMVRIELGAPPTLIAFRAAVPGAGDLICPAFPSAPSDLAIGQ
jgi:hypothetical protein